MGMNCLNSTAEEIQGCGQSGAGFAHIKRVCARSRVRFKHSPDGRLQHTGDHSRRLNSPFSLSSTLI